MPGSNIILGCVCTSALYKIYIIGASLSEPHTSELELWTVVGWLLRPWFGYRIF